MNPKNYTAKCLHKLGCLKSQTKTVIRFQIIIQIGMFLPWLVSQMLKIDKLVCSYAKTMFESFQSQTQEVKRIDSNCFLRVFSINTLMVSRSSTYFPGTVKSNTKESLPSSSNPEQSMFKNPIFFGEIKTQETYEMIYL